MRPSGLHGLNLPPVRLDVPHRSQCETATALFECVRMALAYQEHEVSLDELRDLFDAYLGALPARRMGWLSGWGYRVDSPRRLQSFRDGTVQLNQWLNRSDVTLNYPWETGWVRYVQGALQRELPVIVPVNLGSLYARVWGGLWQPHAVVITGGDGRYAWIQDPALPRGPSRVGLVALVDALIPHEPLGWTISR